MVASASAASASSARWKANGKAKDTDKKKGEKLFGESVPAASQPSDLLEQLAAVTKERDESLERLAKLTDQAAADKVTFDEQLSAMTKRAEEAEAALAEATKKAK
ncbi:hypothetical protein A3463_12890 [Enterobacter chengduensis]|nr:hypothetical protein A3463_12890 [Enterobacter chengduensis]